MHRLTAAGRARSVGGEPPVLTRCWLSAFPRPDGQIARSGRPPNHKGRPLSARRLPTAPAGPPCGREIAARKELGAVAQQ